MGDSSDLFDRFEGLRKTVDPQRGHFSDFNPLLFGIAGMLVILMLYFTWTPKTAAGPEQAKADDQPPK
jgi:hypothetical protein